MKKYFLLMSVAVLLIGALAWAQGEYPGYGGASGLYYGQNPNLSQDQQKESVGIDPKYLTDTQDESRSLLTDQQPKPDPNGFCSLAWGGDTMGNYARPGSDGGTTSGWCW